MPRAEKEAKVKEISERLTEAQAAVLAGYRGLTVQEAADLRAALAEADTRFAVVKNSLTLLAVKEAGLEGLAEHVDGPTAIAFVHGDPVSGAKRLVEQARRFPVLEVRGGFAEGRILTAEEVRTLASLDSREAMLAKVAGLGQASLSRAAFMFQALQAKFLLLMEALKEKVPGEPPVAEDQPDPDRAPGSSEPPAEEPVEAEPPGTGDEERTEETPEEGGT